MQYRSIVTNYIKTRCQNKTIAVACIYCNYKESSKPTIVELLASVLIQLAQDQSKILRYVLNLYRNHKLLVTESPLQDLLTVLRSEIREYSQIYILVDALDDYPDRDRHSLITMLQSLAGNVNLMVTSRILPPIEQQFSLAARLDISAKYDDVHKYIEDRIAREIRLARIVQHNPALQRTIVDKIVSNVGGMSVSCCIIFLGGHFLTFCAVFCLSSCMWTRLSAR